MEQVITRKNQHIEKRVLVSTEGSIQWVLHLPLLLSTEMTGVAGPEMVTHGDLLEKRQWRRF